MIKTILFSAYIFITSIAVVSAQQFSLDDTYESKIKDAYGITDVPLPPGKWKIFDLEVVGTVDTGDFFVYASFMPANISDQERRYNDTVNINLFGSSPVIIKFVNCLLSLISDKSNHSDFGHPLVSNSLYLLLLDINEFI